MNIRVLLVDNHTAIRTGLATLLDKEADISIIAEAGSGIEAMEKIRESVPDVLVMDLSLPDMCGTQATRDILAEHPEIRILVLSIFHDNASVIESLKAGVRGYLVKDCAADKLLKAIRTVYQGKPYFCSAAQEIMMKRCAQWSQKSVNMQVTNRTKKEFAFPQTFQEG
jgi:DNA-binding NarL/FixJ family response regulator